MIVTKSIKMTEVEYEATKEALRLFEKLENELEKLNDENPEDTGIGSLWDKANDAYNAIWEFIHEYHKYMKWSS